MANQAVHFQYEVDTTAAGLIKRDSCILREHPYGRLLGRLTWYAPRREDVRAETHVCGVDNGISMRLALSTASIGHHIDGPTGRQATRHPGARGEAVALSHAHLERISFCLVRDTFSKQDGNTPCQSARHRLHPPF